MALQRVLLLKSLITLMTKKLKIMNRIIALSLLVFTFVFMISCTYEEKYEEYVIKDLSKQINDTLEFKVDRLVNNIEVILSGNVNGESVIEFENGAGRYNKITLKGEINQVYETEWYDSKCNFRYRPITNIQGDSLVLKHRIY